MQPPMAALLIPSRLIGNRLVISAQLPKKDNRLMYKGRLGRDIDLGTGQLAAELCALNILSCAKQALDDDLSRIEAIVSVRGYVNTTPDFHQIAEVLNGASSLFLEVFGPKIGAHCRAAIGASNMPFNASVEVEAEFYVVENCIK